VAAPPAGAAHATLVAALAAADASGAAAAFARALCRALAPTPDLAAALLDRSPIARVADAAAPTLLVLGCKDRRVPPSQGLEFYHALRSRAVLTRVLAFEGDGHAVDKAESEAEAWAAMRAWLLTARRGAPPPS